MRQVGHMPLSVQPQSDNNNNTAASSSNGPSRWQSVKNTVSQGLHKIANFFSGMKNAVASLFERRPSVPTGPQPKPVSITDVQQRIDTAVNQMQQAWAAKPHAQPPVAAMTITSSNDNSLGAFMRNNKVGTDGHAMTSLVKPFLVETSKALTDKALSLLMLHGQNGQPANLELDPLVDPAVGNPVELQRRVDVYQSINDALLDDLIGDPEGKDYASQLANFPLPVQAAIAQVTEASLQQCSWDTHAPDSSKTPDQLLVEQKIRKQVVAHVFLTAVLPALTNQSLALGNSNPVQANGLKQLCKLLQNQFNGIAPGVKEQHLAPLKPIADSNAARIDQFVSVVGKSGPLWGGVTNPYVPIGNAYE